MQRQVSRRFMTEIVHVVNQFIPGPPLTRNIVRRYTEEDLLVLLSGERQVSLPMFFCIRNCFVCLFGEANKKKKKKKKKGFKLK